MKGMKMKDCNQEGKETFEYDDLALGKDTEQQKDFLKKLVDISVSFLIPLRKQLNSRNLNKLYRKTRDNRFFLVRLLGVPDKGFNDRMIRYRNNISGILYTLDVLDTHIVNLLNARVTDFRERVKTTKELKEIIQINLSPSEFEDSYSDIKYTIEKLRVIFKELQSLQKPLPLRKDQVIEIDDGFETIFNVITFYTDILCLDIYVSYYRKSKDIGYE